MRVDVFTMCDFAQINNNKLTIVGTYNQVVASSFPTTYSVCVAMRLTFTQSEIGDQPFSCVIRNEDNNEVTPPITGTCHVGDNGNFVTISFILNFPGVHFNAPGNYKIVFSVMGMQYDTDLILSNRNS